jgi:hypothetical protein
MDSMQTRNEPTRCHGVGGASEARPSSRQLVTTLSPSRKLKRFLRRAKNHPFSDRCGEYRKTSRGGF